MKAIPLILIPLISLLMGCSSVPVKSMVEARAELALAKMEQAPYYAADSYNSALGNLKEAHLYVAGGRQFRAANSAENARWLAFQAREETAYSKASLLRKSLDDVLDGIRRLLGRSYSRDARFNVALNSYNRGVALQTGAEERSAGLKHKKRREDQLIRRKGIVRLYHRAVAYYRKAFPPARGYLGALIKEKQELFSRQLKQLYGNYKTSEKMKGRFLELRKKNGESRSALSEKKHNTSLSILELAMQGKELLEKDLRQADARLELNRAHHLYALYKLKFGNLDFVDSGKQSIKKEMQRKAAIEVSLNNARILFQRADYDAATFQARKVIKLVRLGLADEGILIQDKNNTKLVKRNSGVLKKNHKDNKSTSGKKSSRAESRVSHRKTRTGKKTGVWKNFIVRKLKDHDKLWKISEIVYGTRAKWKIIFDANRDILASPHVIHPGQVLKIPPP